MKTHISKHHAHRLHQSVQVPAAILVVAAMNTLVATCLAGSPACCLPDHTCSALDATACADAGGTAVSTCAGDCDNNGIADACDIAAGADDSCNSNGIPDVCEPLCWPCDRRFSTPREIAKTHFSFRELQIADFDGNLDPDLLAFTEDPWSINWYENIDGLGTYSQAHVITTDVKGIQHVGTGDVDGDGDTDVLGDVIILVNNQYEDVLLLFANDGLGHFGPPQTLLTNLPKISPPQLADIDGDGDGDLILAYQADSAVAWYENLDGEGTFGPRVDLITGAAGVFDVKPVDLDGDGDLDFLCFASNPYRILRYENVDGNGTFEFRQEIPSPYPGDPRIADMNSDGSPDLLVSSQPDAVWYPNLGGTGELGAAQPVDHETGVVTSAFPADVDGDGDQDVLATVHGVNADDPRLAVWYENVDGNGVFGAKKILAPALGGAGEVLAADVDGDGDPDAVIQSGYPTELLYQAVLRWYQNGADCNANGLNDGCDIDFGVSGDCNGNWNPDECDIAAGTSDDCDENGVPDECQPYKDCNGNIIQDICDIASGASNDCNHDGIPDDCQPDEDCNSNGVRDLCELGPDTGGNCNGDLIPDECQIDEDCNGNGVRDLCELDAGLFPDCNDNLADDVCDVSTGRSPDENMDGIPDDCCDPPTPTLVGHVNQRFLSLAPIGTPGDAVAIRIMPVTLPDFEQFEGLPLWVGPPGEYPDENSATPGLTFTAAPLQCTPYYRDWSDIDVLQVFGAEIIPLATYDVQVVEQRCGAANENNFSAPLVATTGKYGDCAEPFYPAGAAEPDFTDISTTVDKFLADPIAPSKVKVQMQPNRIFPERPVDFNTISHTVDAFLGMPYWITVSGPCTCPSRVGCGATACTNDAQCANDGLCIDGFCADACGRCTP